MGQSHPVVLGVVSRRGGSAPITGRRCAGWHWSRPAQLAERLLRRRLPAGLRILAAGRVSPHLMERRLRRLRELDGARWGLGAGVGLYLGFRPRPMRITNHAQLAQALRDGADLRGADLREASLDEDDLQKGRLNGVKWNEQTVWPDSLADKMRSCSHELEPGVFVVDGQGDEHSPTTAQV